MCACASLWHSQHGNTLMFLPDPPGHKARHAQHNARSHTDAAVPTTPYILHMPCPSLMPVWHSTSAIVMRPPPSPLPIRPTTQQLDTRTASDQSGATRQTGSPTARLGACRRRLLLLRQIGTLMMLGPPVSVIDSLLLWSAIRQPSHTSPQEPAAPLETSMSSPRSPICRQLTQSLRLRCQRPAPYFAVLAQVWDGRDYRDVKC